MKRPFFAALLLLAATQLSAGVRYDFRSVTTGMTESAMAGTVKADGANFRMDFQRGDGMIFRDGAIVLSRDGARTLTVADPASKTFYDLNASDLLGGAGALLRQFGDMVKFQVKNPRVAVRDAGPGGKVEGYDTKRSVVDSSYDIEVEALGQKMTMQFATVTEAWTTDKMPADLMNFLQLRGFRTGIPQVDTMIAAQSGAIKGFPLKQVTTVTVKQNGREMKTTTTATVTNIRQTAVAADQFALPAGYTKTQNPVEKMVK